MLKKATRAPNVPEPVCVDSDFIPYLSSQHQHVISKPKKDGEPSSIGIVKNVGLNLSQMENLSHQHRCRKNKRKTIHNQSDSIEWYPSYLNQMVQGNKFGAAYGARTGRIKEEYGVELLTCIDAALALMELANESLGLPKNRLYSNVDKTPSGLVLMDQLNDTITYSNHSQAAGYKTKLFEKFQQSSVHNEENGERLPKKKKKFRNAPSLPPTKYNNDDDGEENNLQNKVQQHVKACMKRGCDPLDMSMMSSFKCETEKKKQKKKVGVPFMSGLVEYDCIQFDSRKVLDEPVISTLKKHALTKGETNDSFSYGLNANSFLSKRRAKNNAMPEKKPLGKLELPPVSPKVHKGFSFSIMHFLSAIRTAMVTPEGEEDTSVIGKHLQKDNFNIAQTEKMKLPSLTIHQIIERVRRSPIGPCILEAREPLEDLVRGALHIFSSKLAPLGVKGWQPLTSYLKSTKSWSWIGPISFKQAETIEEEVSVKAWGLPHKMLAKLVDSFANWLRSVRETLQQIKSLPAPPMISMPKTADLGQRLKSARPRKCTATISPSSAELRAYFHIEEALRYSVPERAFLYTAVDGRKSAVAPMRRSSGKPSSKVRDHFMLKTDRPPHVTVLCLVRDAAARLPENMGTRTDVCTLMRDSQYIVEDISDEQLNQVVSRGLDRLHYENDPCVQYNGDTKLWVYLHGDREEDDFDDDGTTHRRSC
ncbi:hypothetical protein AB3S75_033228 [Citrus x aurantiifolia]